MQREIIMNVKFDDVKAGDILISDGGFTCIRKNARCIVREHTPGGALYIPCDHGVHYLDGQLDHSTGELVGLSKAPDNETA
jgi:hypothetical protein